MEKSKKERSGIDWALVLPTSEKDAISAAELCVSLGVSDTRTLRHIIFDARMNGEPVCSNGDGYFLGSREDQEGITHCINILRKRAFSSLMQAARLNKWKNGGDKFEQMTIGDFLKEEEKKY